MPAIPAAISAIVVAGTKTLMAVGIAKATAASITAFTLQAAGTAVLTTAINAVVQPSVGAGGSPTQWQSDTDSGVPFVMGRRAVAGHAVHIDEWGPDNRYLSVVNVYSGAGPIKAFGDFYADETVVSFGGSYNKVSTGSYKDVMWMDRRMGAQPDTALASPSDPAVAGSLPGWTSAYKLSGKASSMWTLALDKERKRYPAGAPKPLQVIEGIYGYDPRLDSTYPGGSGSCRLNDRSTYVWIENPIIGALNYAIGLRENGKVVAGISDDDTPSLNGIDTDAFIACANVADANSWTLSAAWTSKDDKHQVYIAMLQAGGAKDCTVAGKLSCYTRGAPKTSVVTISAADTAGPVEISTAAPRIGRVNTIIPRCVLETHKWEMTPCDEVTVAAHVTTDRAKRSRGMDYPFVPGAVQASQLAGLDIEDSREPITGRMPLKRYMQQLKPGDAFTITEPGFYLDGLKAVVVNRDVDTSSGVVTITFRSDTDAKYDFALGLDPTPPTYPELTPPDPNEVPAASSDDWDATGASVTTGSGQTLVGHPALRVTGDFANENVASAVIEYRKSADSAWIYHGEFASVADFETLIQPLSPSTLYDVSVRLRNIFGVLGDEADRLVISDVLTPPFFTSDDSVNLGGVPAQTVFREIESLQAQLAAAFASIETERTTRVSEDEAFAQQVFTLRTDVDGNTAQIQTNFTALSTSISANASAITSLDARVTTAEGDIVANAAAISTEATARANADSAFASQLVTLQAEVDANADGVADNAAAIVTEQTARADGDSALSSQITSLTATVGGNTAAIAAEATARATADETLARRADTQEARLAGALAAIQVETETRATRDESFATRFYSVEAEVAGNAAAILVEQTARVSGDDALASQITALTATVDGNTAAITTEAAARAAADSAFASQIATLETEVDANAAAITTEQTARVNGDNALASQISTLETEVDANAAAITSEATARASGDSANASLITALDARVTTNEGDISDNAANITTEQGVRATQTSAIAQRLDRLSAQIAGVAAGITTETEARATDTEALARREQTLSARLGTAEALVSTLEEVFIDENGAVAAWINRVVAGAATATVEITARDENGNAVSHIRLKADSIGFGEDAFFEYVDEDPAYANQPNIYLRDKDGTVVLDGRDLSVADWRRPDVLTRAMKVQTVPYWQSLIDEEAALVARAALLSISSTAYEAAMDAFIAELDSYDTGQPDWDDMTGDTVIDNATLTPLINTVETTRNALRASIRAALRWSDLLERPTWVTDDRVPNGLNGSGDLIRALTSDSLVPSLPASKIGSGTFANARIAQASVTQHQAALALAASQVTSGTFADARIAQSSVTQHQGALAIGSGQVSGLGSLAALNNISDAQIDASAAIKLTKIDRLTGEDAYNNAPSAPPATVNFTATTFTEIATVTLNNVPANPIIILNNTQEFWPVGSDAANSAATKLEWRIREWDGAAGADIAAGEITFRDDFGTIVYDSGGPLETVGGRIYSAFRNGTVDYILEFRVSAGTQVNFLETTKLQVRAI